MADLSARILIELLNCVNLSLDRRENIAHLVDHLNEWVLVERLERRRPRDLTDKVVEKLSQLQSACAGAKDATNPITANTITMQIFDERITNSVIIVRVSPRATAIAGTRDTGHERVVRLDIRTFGVTGEVSIFIIVCIRAHHKW